MHINIAIFGLSLLLGSVVLWAFRHGLEQTVGRDEASVEQLVLHAASARTATELASVSPRAASAILAIVGVVFLTLSAFSF
jgi:hypothetical protein